MDLEAQKRLGLVIECLPAGDSKLIAYNFITEVACNGNLQIEMHSFPSQQLPQR